MSNAQLVERLNALHPKSIDLSLGRLNRLLGELGNPQDKLPPVIHVAGTNGKGSTVAFLRAFFEAAGYTAHVYTSPHLVNFNERIRVAGELISDEDLDAILTDCETANGDHPITFFEITTAAAFLAFSRTPADVVLLETGLGGRLDATNVVSKPSVTCITPVSLDHQHYLGENLDDIMREKLGILKKGVPCVTAQQGSKKLEKIISEAAKLVDAELFNEGKRWFSRSSAGKRGPKNMFFTGLDGVERTFSMPALVGRHQMLNAGLAIQCTEVLKDQFEISDAAIEKGLTTVRWRGRLEHLTSGPLVDLLAEGWELWLDGGHNKGASEALAQQYRTWRGADLWAIFGGLNQRDPLEFFRPLEGKLAGLRAVTIPGQENAVPASEAAARAQSLRIDSKAMDSVGAAITDIIDAATAQGLRPGRILICGSLYLAGHVIELNTP